MPAIKSSSIRDLKDRINIADVVSREVTLKRAGSNFKGLSPFNQEKTPSFFVSPDKGLYKCFSSGKAGDIISFVMETERLSFTEAVETLAKRHGFELEYEAGGRPKEDRSLRQELFDLHQFVADYYHEQFHAKNDGGKWIRDYWTQSRKFELSVADEYKIGFAPVSGVELGTRVLEKKFSKEAIEASGLFYTRRGLNPNTMGYRFRGRLMIPIRDHQGRITAFTARQLELTPQDDPSREAKYVNSPETPIFNKGSLLFNLDRARMEVGPEDPFIMVEGQLDAIRCQNIGLKGVVAPQGTGITENQLRLMKRYEPRVRCFLDGDAAGQQAALRMLPLALQQGVETSFIPLEPGQDPDDIFSEQGIEAMNQLLEKEIDCVAFATSSIAPDPASLTPQAKAKNARELFAIFQKADSQAAQQEFIKQVAFHLDLDAAALLSDFGRYLRGVSAPRETRKKSEEQEHKPKEPVYSVERDLVSLCLHEPELGKEIAHIVEEAWIDTTLPEGELLNTVLNEFLHDMWNGPDSLNEHLEEAELKSLAANILFEKPDLDDAPRLANQAIKKLVINFANKKYDKLRLELAQKEGTYDASYSVLMEKWGEIDALKLNPPQIGTPAS